MSIQNLAGQTLGQYELRELLGEGGMGAVYRAFQRTLEREVAIKVLPASLAAQTGYIERFTREARTAAALEHQNIVPVYDYGTQGSISYVVMRLLTGGTLADRLTHSFEENRPLPSLQETSDITRQLASALDYAHSQGVIHRDIKANNIMFDRQGTPFVVDFGIAKLLNATSALTGTGVAMGTPSYMAPEQWQGKDIGPAADQYALAVLVYAMLTGKMPFEADSPYQLMHKHMFDVPTPIHTHRGDLPEALQKVFDRAFEKEPKNRFPTTTDFAKAIDEAVRVSPKQEPSGFFVTPLPVRKFNVPLQPTPPNMEGPTITPTGSQIPEAMLATIADVPSGGSPPTTVPPTLPPAAEMPSRNRRLQMAVLTGIAALIVIIGLAVVLSSSGDDGGDGGEGNNTQETSDPLIIAQGILTATASANSTLTAQANEEPTTEPTEAVTDIPESPSPTATPTTVSSPAATRTNTPNAVETLEARATRDSERTAAAQATEEGTEIPTATPSPSRTPSPTSTPTRRSTLAPSATATSTSTRQSTTASSATATPSNSPSPTRTFTATVDIAATSDAATATQQAAGTRQSATQNAVQTLAARATSDASKTLAARATNSVGPTQTAQAIAAIQIAETNREVNVRGEPNTSAPIVATLRQGTSVTIIGSNDDETWFNVRLNNGTEGWIRADLLTVFGPPTATPSPTPEPQVEEFDGVPMVLVPAGCFVMGSDDTQLEEAIGMGLPQNIADVEKPAEKICFDAPFWIDQYEVTNGQFDQYNGQAAMPAVNDDANKPREQVSWYEAKAYCEQRGGRLPTEAEWEYAARGPAGLIYPWGNEFEPDNVVFLDNSGKEAQPVGSRPDGVSWVGAYDMSGNVWEWTNSLFREYPYDAADGREGEGEENRSIRGGSYQDLDEFLRTSMRSFWIASADAYPSLGFRCARDTEE